MPNKRAPSIMGDDERATIGGARTPALGVPVEIQGDSSDKTPPPMEPPDITDLPAYKKLDPEMRELVMALHNTDREQDVALTKVWPARHVMDELSNMRKDAAVLMERTKGLDELKAGVSSLGGVTVRLVALVEEREKRDTRIEASVGTLVDRMGNAEKTAQGHTAAIDALAQKRREGDEAAMKEVGDLEQKLEKVKSAHDERITSLEETRSRFRGALWLVGVLATIFGVVGASLWHWIHGGGTPAAPK